MLYLPETVRSIYSNMQYSYSHEIAVMKLAALRHVFQIGSVVNMMQLQ